MSCILPREELTIAFAEVIWRKAKYLRANFDPLNILFGDRTYMMDTTIPLFYIGFIR